MESTSLKDSKYDDDQLISSIMQNKVIDGNNILRSLILKCKEEMANNYLQKPLGDYVERVAHYTGLSKMIINKAVSKMVNEIDYKDKYFKLDDRISVFKQMSLFYTNQINPTYKNLYTWYINNNIVITFSQFQYMMNCLRFEHHKTHLGEEMLLEDPSLTFERYVYLKKLYNFRSECAPIYYIDERFFESTFSLRKPWMYDVDISSSACDGYVFFHAVSKQGFLNGLFCSPTTKQDFIKWISHILMPLLPGPSVIVMDNSDLHGSVINKMTKYHSKNDMLEYLRQRNIPCNEYLHKAELYELIKKCSVKNICYDVDELFKAHGHHVLRLPANFHDLSLTHFLWKYLHESEPNLFLSVDLSQIKLVLLEKLSNLPQNLWDSFHKSLLTIEEDIFKIDSKIYKALESNYKIG